MSSDITFLCIFAYFVIYYMRLEIIMTKNRNLLRIIYIVLYILITFLIGTLFMFMFGAIVSSARGLDTGTIMKILLGDKGNVYTPEELNCAYTAQGYSNALSYLVLFVLAIIMLFPDFKEDILSVRDNKKFYILYTLIAAVIFVGVAYLISFLVTLAVKESENQKTIIAIMKTNALVPMIISTIIFAPVVEELVYRKIIFYYTQNSPIWARYLISIIFFTFPHVITSVGKFAVGEYFLMIIPYLTSAFMLAFIYHRGKYNIYTSIVCHVLNNVLAVILVFI